MRELIVQIREAVNGKLFRCNCSACDNRAFYFEEVFSEFFAYDLKTSNIKRFSLKELYDGYFHQISPRDLTPDEVENLAHYERQHGLEKAASAQTPTQNPNSHGTSNHLYAVNRAKDTSRVALRAQSQASRAKVVGDEPQFKGTVNETEYLDLGESP